MVIADFMSGDLLARADWSDPDFPAFARILHKLSHDFEMSDGRKNMNVKAITLTPIRVSDVPWVDPQLATSKVSDFISTGNS